MAPGDKDTLLEQSLEVQPLANLAAVVMLIISLINGIKTSHCLRQTCSAVKSYVQIILQAGKLQLSRQGQRGGPRQKRPSFRSHESSLSASQWIRHYSPRRLFSCCTISFDAKVLQTLAITMSDSLEAKICVLGTQGKHSVVTASKPMYHF